jgi:hypothetical protein
VSRGTTVAALAGFGAALVLASGALAGQLDPRSLVLRRVDVPVGFRVESGEGGLRSNVDVRRDPEVRPLLAFGRITGYTVVFQRGHESELVNSSAEVFRGVAGAARALRWLDGKVRTGAQPPLRRATLSLGDGGVAYSGPGAVVVLWRTGRVLAVVNGDGIPRWQTLTLAGTQQRRIETALR